MSKKAVVTSKTFAGLRIEVDTSVALDDVMSRLRKLMGHTSVPEIVELAKRSPSQVDYAREVEQRFVGESGFMLFAEIDHGGWIGIFGIHQRAFRWILGNPLIAITMIRHDINAGLFVPVEVYLTEKPNGAGSKLLYVQPSSLIAINGNSELLAAAKALDVKLEALITNATKA